LRKTLQEKISKKSSLGLSAGIAGLGVSNSFLLADITIINNLSTAEVRD